MLNVPNDVKNLFKLDSCHKNFHVHFPNGEMDDLGNADVVQESVEFSESICSQNTFKFGKSESSTIEFETVGVPNMMGMKIECGIEVDCSSLGADWIAGHPVDDTLPFLEPQTAWVYDSEPELNEETGSIISLFNDDDSTIDSLTIPITPTQNLNGYSKPWAAGAGKNLLDSATVFADTARYTVNADESVTVLSTNGQAWTSTAIVGIPLEAGTYTFSRSNASGSVQIRQSSNNYTANILNLSNKVSSGSFTLTSADTIKIKPNTGSTAVYPNTSFFQLELGSTATSWTPYSNICPFTGLTGLSAYVSPTQDQQDATTYAVDWTSEAGTAYAGSIEVVSGTLKARPHYASYNGETLVGPWMSSMDEYAAGSTPTTGAEVVDLGGAETTYQLTPTQISLLPGQNYLWASNGALLTASVSKQRKTLYYRIPYGQFTVRECPRDHQAMTHRKVTAYTDTRFLESEYQKLLFDSKGFEKKYTPKFQNMFYAIVGMNNEPMILGAGYTKTAHDAFSSVIDSLQDDMIQFVVSGASKHFKLQVYMKVFTIGGSSQDAYTIDALYGIEGIENVDISNLVEPIAKALVDDYGVSEEVAYDYSTYDSLSRYPMVHPEWFSYATVTKPKIIGFQARKDLSGGGSAIFNESQYIDLTGMSGLYCINPDREGFITYVSVLAGITVTPWSSDNPVTGHAIGDPISTYGSGFDEAFLNQYTAPSGSAFDTEMKLEPTGSEKTNVSGAPKRYWFTDAVDISKLMTDYLEVSALFAAQNRTGGLKVFSIDNSVLKEQLSAGEYAEFWWDEYDVSPIGRIKYILTKKDEEEETTYTFGSGQSVYDLTQNEFFKQFKKSKSEIETFLDVSFIPKLGAVAFTPIELTVGNGLPYIEAGDYIQATSEDGVAAKSFVLTHTISGIQHLTETIESSGGDMVNSVFSEGN